MGESEERTARRIRECFPLRAADSHGFNTPGQTQEPGEGESLMEVWSSPVSGVLSRLDSEHK